MPPCMVSEGALARWRVSLSWMALSVDESLQLLLGLRADHQSVVHSRATSICLMCQYVS